MKTLLVSLLLIMAFQDLRAQAQDLEAVHEWGTFTTFSGSDGTPIAWWSQALEGPAALPEFVVPVPRFSKAMSPYITRMETPVLYFYAKRPTEANVQVQYLQGVLTDIFPAGHHLARPSNLPANSAYSWTVDLLPPSSPELINLPLVGKRGAHYAHAREVPDAWLVKSKDTGVEASGVKSGTEKFIFYRGAGTDSFPLTTSLGEDGTLTANTFAPITGDAFFVSVSQGTLRWRGVKLAMKPDEQSRYQPVTIPALKAEGSADGLAAALRQSLTTAGLTPAEAAAMVATWKEAWLDEDGTRLLYLMPEAWVNQRLPLKITPAPKELKRVFVARNEIFPPQQEQTLVDTLTGNHTDAERAKMITSLNLGRFASPALERALKINEQKLRNAFYGAMLK